jgi:hypothetical protein
MSSKIVLCNQKLFEEKVIEIFDPIHNQRYWFVKCKSGQEFSKILNQIIPNYKDLVEDSDDSEEAGGECLDLVLDGRLIVVLWSSLDLNTLTHECLHAILFSVKSRGISKDDDEALCYMLGFLVGEITKKLNVSLKKERKPKEVKTQLHFNNETSKEQ